MWGKLILIIRKMLNKDKNTHAFILDALQPFISWSEDEVYTRFLFLPTVVPVQSSTLYMEH